MVILLYIHSYIIQLRFIYIHYIITLVILSWPYIHIMNGWINYGHYPLTIRGMIQVVWHPAVKSQWWPHIRLAWEEVGSPVGWSGTRGLLPGFFKLQIWKTHLPWIDNLTNGKRLFNLWRNGLKEEEAANTDGLLSTNIKNWWMFIVFSTCWYVAQSGGFKAQTLTYWTQTLCPNARCTVFFYCCSMRMEQKWTTHVCWSKALFLARYSCYVMLCVRVLSTARKGLISPNA